MSTRHPNFNSYSKVSNNTDPKIAMVRVRYLRTLNVLHFSQPSSFFPAFAPDGHPKIRRLRVVQSNRSKNIIIAIFAYRRRPAFGRGRNIKFLANQSDNGI